MGRPSANNSQLGRTRGQKNSPDFHILLRLFQVIDSVDASNYPMTPQIDFRRSEFHRFRSFHFLPQIQLTLLEFRINLVHIDVSVCWIECATLLLLLFHQSSPCDFFDLLPFPPLFRTALGQSLRIATMGG